MRTYIFIWKVSPLNVPRALVHMAIDRISLKADSRITFFKSLGTGAGKTFTPSDADPLTWALLITTDLSEVQVKELPAIRAWRKFAVSESYFELESISSHGQWAGQEPFGNVRSERWDGEVATITRARIAWRENPIFWRSVPPVTTSLLSTPGLISAMGIGEAPIGLQGTFSHWNSSSALRAFAYEGKAHKRAIELTSERKWYREELFARFAVIKRESKTLKN